MASQLWCEKRMELRLGLRLKDTGPAIVPYKRSELIVYSETDMSVSTKEMKIGRAFHKELSGMQHSYDPTTLNHWMYSFIGEIRSGLTNLLKGKLTRELQLFGTISSVPMACRVDELQVKDGCLHIMDYKTRRTRNVPSPQVQIPYEFQLMIHHKLLSDSMQGIFGHEQLMQFYQIPPKAKESNKNIHKYARETYALFRNLPRLSEELAIHYHLQETTEPLGVSKFTFNQEKFSKWADFASQYWLGKRSAIPVGERNKWKCKHCQVSQDCEHFRNRSL